MASKLFVGNLNFQTTREEIEQLFGRVGTVTDVFLPTDRDTGRVRGFAFVTFESNEDAAKAIEQFNGYELGGRPLRVNAAEDRPRREFSPRPSYGGEGGGFGGGRDQFGGKSKGSRRNIRAKKRSL